MPFHGNNRRRDQRHLFFTNIEYYISSPLPEEMYLGSNINMSDSGMCMYTYRRLNEGDHIRIKNALPVPHQKAAVRWTKRYSEDFFKVGLEFIEDGPDPSANTRKRSSYN
jgi:hypothetical protein